MAKAHKDQITKELAPCGSKLSDEGLLLETIRPPESSESLTPKEDFEKRKKCIQTKLFYAQVLLTTKTRICSLLGEKIKVLAAFANFSITDNIDLISILNGTSTGYLYKYCT